MKKILVLCTGNACRSQMAEGYLRFFTDNKAVIVSAGVQPTQVHPLAIEVMNEDNIDISEAQSKGVEHFSDEAFDYLITVCNHAEQNKPVNISAKEQIHYDIPDPEEVAEGLADQKQAFIDAREQVKREMLRFIGAHDDLYKQKTSSVGSRSSSPKWTEN